MAADLRKETLGQVIDNCKTANETELLSDKETEAFWEAMGIYRDNTLIPRSELEKYSGLIWNNVSVPAILQAYSMCLVQLDCFADKLSLCMVLLQ